MQKSGPFGGFSDAIELTQIAYAYLLIPLWVLKSITFFISMSSNRDIETERVKSIASDRDLQRESTLAEIAELFPEYDPQAKVSGDALAAEAARIAEALLFAATEPLSEQDIERRLPRGLMVAEVLERLQDLYATRGVNLVRVAGKWMFRTAPDLAWLLGDGGTEPKRLSRAALETLAIIAYHQPVTRAEIEDIRGVAISKGTIDILLETGWVRLRGRRRAPGRPVTYGTTEAFLVQFCLDSIADLPGFEELRGAGLFDGGVPQGFAVPRPSDDPALTPDEDPLEESSGDLGEPANEEARGASGETPAPPDPRADDL
jgi:segregation and condensation protein B